jgi:2-keto-4-pentenoate hydratase/2-oxohepta-3-ene-1,7-dioic acid hydratase in catechol pathway
MKLVTIDAREVAGRPGVLLDDGNILDLTAAPSTLSQSQWIPQSVVSILAAGDAGLEHAQRLVAAIEQLSPQQQKELQAAGTLLPLKSTALMAPVRRPGAILVSLPDSGSGYLKSPGTATGDAATLSVVPTANQVLTAHGMLAVVLGKPFYRGTEEQAQAAMSAYTLMIDLALAASQSSDNHADAGVWRDYVDARQFAGACPMGPAMITVDESGDPAAIDATIRINGVVKKQGSLWYGDDTPAQRLAKLSQRYAFLPGDIIGFSSRPGDTAGLTRLESGDQFSARLDGIMELSVSIE